MAWSATRVALALAALAGCALGSEPLASHFDQQLTVFSPQGRLYQVEFAMAAVGRSATTTVALKGADAGGCCVLASHRRRRRPPRGSAGAGAGADAGAAAGAGAGASKAAAKPRRSLLCRDSATATVSAITPTIGCATCGIDGDGRAPWPGSKTWHPCRSPSC